MKTEFAVIFDQYAAIKWVRENIEAFGGNPNNIVLSGQSAGAMSVDIHLSNPLCKGWFSAAIMMSGGGLQRFLAKPLTPEKTRAFWGKIVENAGVKSIAELKKADKEVLYRAWDKACKEEKLKSMLYTLPVCDGKIITQSNFNSRTIPQMPKIIGITKNDMVPAVWRPFEAVDYEISNQLAKSFIAFAKNGNPNCNEIPVWKPGTAKVMTFCENTRPAHWNIPQLLKNTFIGGASI